MPDYAFYPSESVPRYLAEYAGPCAGAQRAIILKFAFFPDDGGKMVLTVRFKFQWAVRCLTAAEDFLKSSRKSPAHLPFGIRVLGNITAGLVVSAIATADLPAARFIQMSSVPSRPDPRIARLENVFKLYHCPAPHQTSEYIRAADDYGLDYRLLPAVSIRETRCGAAERQEHNRWGYHPGRQSFSSVEVGIEVLAHRLSQNPLYRGKTLHDKLFTYNPRAAYPAEVARIMRQIE